MLLVFWVVFSVPVISRIESIGGERAGGEGGKPKAGQSNHLDSSSSAVPSVWDTDW